MVWGVSRRWVFHRRLLGGSFTGMGQGGCVPGTGEFGQWTCSNWGKSDCWSTRYSCYRFAARVTLVGKAREVAWLVSMVKGTGGGHEWCSISGVLLVGIRRMLSTGNPSHRKGNGRREGAREGAVLGCSGLALGSGGDRVKFQERVWKRMVYLLTKVGFGVEAPIAAQVGRSGQDATGR